MALLKLNAKQFARYHKSLAHRFKPTLLRGIHAGAQRAIPYLVDATRTAKPASEHGSTGAANTGYFINRWRVLRTKDGAIIKNVTPYGPVIDGGRRRGAKMPPLKPLIAWLRRRLGKSAEEAKRMAYPVARAIARRGLKARKILTSREARQKILDLVKEETIHEIERELSRGE